MIFNILVRGWLFFKRGLSNINFFLSLIILISVREIDFITLLVGVLAIPITMLIGWFDINHVSERTQPKLNPYMQDYLKSLILVNKGLMLLSNDKKDLAINYFRRANETLDIWYEGKPNP